MKKVNRYSVCILMQFVLWNHVIAEDLTAAKMEPSPKFELVMREEIMVDALPQAVWPYMLNRKSWMSFDLETLSGKRGEEGELILVSQQDNEKVPAQYLLKTVKVVQQQQVVSKVFPVEGDDFIGFSDFSLVRVNGGSKLILSFYMEIKMAKKSADPLEDLQNIKAGSQLKIRENIERIKQLAENGRI